MIIFARIVLCKLCEMIWVAIDLGIHLHQSITKYWPGWTETYLSLTYLDHSWTSRKVGIDYKKICTVSLWPGKIYDRNTFVLFWKMCRSPLRPCNRRLNAKQKNSLLLSLKITQSNFAFINIDNASFTIISTYSMFL